MGKITKKGFAGERKTTWKPDNSPVTEVDLAVNEYLVKEIKKNFPDHGIISEELPEEKGDSDYTWYIDPIDGTIPFSQGITYFANLIGLARGDEMILATACDPIRDELFFAQKGKGAYLNGKQIKSTANQELSKAFVDIEVWRGAKHNLSAVREELFKHIYCDFRKACIGLSLCYVAVGRMDAAMFAGDTPWDVAATYLICTEAGVKCTNLDGTVWQPGQEVKGMIAARPKLHQDILEIVKKHL